MTNIYSYCKSWGNIYHADLLYKTIRDAYLRRSLLLILFIPFDIFFIIYFLIFAKKIDYLFVTDKWPDLIDLISKKSNVAIVSSPRNLLRNLKSNHKYLPASIFYILTSIGFFLSDRYVDKWSVLVVKLISAFLRLICSNSPVVIVHSDALPFARSIVFATKILSGRTICIQHGIFHSNYIVGEIDGTFSEFNIVRSEYDASIIRKLNPSSQFYIMPEFFKVKISLDRVYSSSPQILLLGEGFHIIDEVFNRNYIETLISIYRKLSAMNVRVKFRPHPSERNRDWASFFSSVDISPLDICLANVNAVIGFSSTLLQECAEISIPAFSVRVGAMDSDVLSNVRNDALIKSADDLDSIVIAANNHFLTGGRPLFGRSQEGARNLASIILNIK